MLMLQEQKCGDDNKTTIKTSNELHLDWKKHFHRNSINLVIYADFEAVNEKGISSIGKKTTNTYKQNPVINGYHILSDLEVDLKNGYYKSPLGCKNADWVVN